jgi:hypothetical protein
MKCEICNCNDAETAIVLDDESGERELYVCKACAGAERKKRQKKSQTTRKIEGLAPGMSITVSGAITDPPPFIGAILEAMGGMVDNLEKASKIKQEESEIKYERLPVSRVKKEYRIAGALHLEGLHLIGELEAVQRSAKALGMRLVGIDADGVKSTGHAFNLEYSGALERAKRFVGDLLEQERNARVRLYEEMPRVFGDSLCRALAILKNARLLSSGELFDLLSPLRLAALEGMLEGIDLATIENMISQINLSEIEGMISPVERDKIDAARADEINSVFEDVILNETAEGKFL